MEIGVLLAAVWIHRGTGFLPQLLWRRQRLWPTKVNVWNLYWGDYVYLYVHNTGKLQDAQKVLKDTIATIEKSITAKETFCQVSSAFVVASYWSGDDYFAIHSLGTYQWPKEKSW